MKKEQKQESSLHALCMTVGKGLGCGVIIGNTQSVTSESLIRF